MGTWTNSYIAFIEEKLVINGATGSSGSKTTGFVRVVEKLWTDANVRIVLRCDAEALAPLIPTLHIVLKLEDVIRETNMHLHDERGILQKYETTSAIVSVHAHYRLAVYEKRRLYIIAKLERELVVLENKRRFVDDVINRKLQLHGMADDEITLALSSFEKVDESYDYLLNMPLRATTQSKLQQLDRDMDLRNTELSCVRETAARDLWLNDLTTLEKELECFNQRKSLRYKSLQRRDDAKPVKKRKAQSNATQRGSIVAKRS